MKLEGFGWSDFFARAFEPYAREGYEAGRVCLGARGAYTLYTARGEIEAGVSGKLRHGASAAGEWPVVGDWVAHRERVIHGVLPRRTRFSRKEPGVRIAEQVLAANVDVLLLVSGLDSDFNLRRIERSLVLAWESGAAPVIILNKEDLCDDVAGAVTAAETVAPGVPVLAASALAGRGLEQLSRHVAPGQTAALAGASGVGKSTILNQLLGEERQRTLPVRASDSRGRHTTSHRELVRLPAGWLIMDLPGLRELQIWTGEQGLDRTFEDITDLAARCRFRDCRHQGEPGCAVADALEDGGLDPTRFHNYAKMRRELAHVEREQDIRARLEEKRRSKRLCQYMKKFDKRR